MVTRSNDPKTVTKSQSTIPPAQTDNSHKIRTDNRMDKLEDMLIKQVEDQREFRDMIMCGMGMEYDDDEPNDSDYPLTQRDASSWGTQLQGGPDNEVTTGTAPDIEASVTEDTTDNSWGFCKETNFGSPVNEQIAQNLTTMLTTQINETKLADTMNTYLSPQNIPALKVPAVNEEIWHPAQPRARSIDVKAQKVQKSLQSGISALVSNLDKPSQSQIDALACLSAANTELNAMRREIFRAELAPKYLHLCRPSVKVTDFLFGDNLANTLRDIESTNKATSQVVKNPIRSRGFNRNQPYRPQFRPSMGRGWKKNFLGYGQWAAPAFYPPQVRGRGRGRGLRQRQQSQAQPAQAQPQTK